MTIYRWRGGVTLPHNNVIGNDDPEIFVRAACANKTIPMEKDPMIACPGRVMKKSEAPQI
jgi:hypothetical protein